MASITRSIQDLPRMGVRRFAKAVLALVFQLAGLLRWRRDPGVPILCYHSVDDSGSLISTSVAEFEKQMALLARWGYRTIPLGELCDRLRSGRFLPRKSVVLTFDDGDRNNHEKASPILERHGFAATVFIVTRSMGGGIDWTRTDDVPDLKLLTWDDAKAMLDLGWEVEGHSETHPNLRRLDPARVREELGQSKREMEARLARPVTLLAYPYGEHTPQIERVVEELGYLGAVTIEMGMVRPGDAVFRLKRMSVNAMAGVGEWTRMTFFKSCLLGTAAWYTELQRWLPGLVNPERPWENDPLQVSSDERAAG